MSVNWIFIPAAFLVPVPLQAHVGDWIVPVFEITDEQLGRIDPPASAAFVRFRVLFDTDALGTGSIAAEPVPALRWVSLPFRF